ncbi:MAG: hypothetical protein QGI83_08825 [Candidatus Latescibacteria bacterium]|nr:hypothetical protein [Candidatus Latescibacterota bacterium]
MDEVECQQAERQQGQDGVDPVDVPEEEQHRGERVLDLRDSERHGTKLPEHAETGHILDLDALSPDGGARFGDDLTADGHRVTTDSTGRQHPHVAAHRDGIPFDLAGDAHPAADRDCVVDGLSLRHDHIGADAAFITGVREAGRHRQERQGGGKNSDTLHTA